jgi:O-antigen ligase
MSLNTVSLFLFVASWAGVAMQSFAMLMVVTSLVFYFRKCGDRRAAALAPFHKPLVRWSCIFGSCWLLWAILASQINPATTDQPPGFLGGYLWWVLSPWTASIFLEAWHAQDDAKKSTWLRLFEKLLLLLCFIICLTVLSQWLLGWKIQGTMIVDSERRARALFSHPLTLAYIVLLYVPFGLALLVQHPRHKSSLLSAVTLGVLLITSVSRTVQAVVLLILVIWAVFFLRRRVRMAFLSACIVVVSLLAFTDNPVRQRFRETASHPADRQQNLYPDDRLAFWAVHWEMFKEKPVVGHGLSYKQDYLFPYYAAKGLGDFKKKYPAHNMYLQLLVNTGITGILFWFGRVVVVALAAILLIRQRNLFGWAAVGAICAMALASLTQNAFQDSAVRFHWALLEGLLLWTASRQKTG